MAFSILAAGDCTPWPAAQSAAESFNVTSVITGLSTPWDLVWGPDGITLQAIRAGFPCFGASLIGYVEATRRDDDDKNRLCPPTSFGNSMVEWARMNHFGTRAVMSFMSEPDIKEWSNLVAVNPARVAPEYPGSAALDQARERLTAHMGPGLARLAELA